ncbi:MAG: hypothetical protein WBL61_03200, partial [Bryobacteraceae bacterium]
DQEDWFRAEAMLNNALVAKCEDPSKRPSIARGGTRTESEMVVEFRKQPERYGTTPSGPGRPPGKRGRLKCS